MVVGTEGAIRSAIYETGASARKHCVEKRFKYAATAAGVKEQPIQTFDGPVHDITLVVQSPSESVTSDAHLGTASDLGKELVGIQQPLDSEHIRAACA